MIIFSVPPFAADLILGLLNRDHRKRYNLRDIENHQWYNAAFSGYDDLDYAATNLSI